VGLASILQHNSSSTQHTHTRETGECESQVLAGSVLGWLAAQTFPESSKAKAKEYYGWHPNNPAKSASALAATTAAATGVPQAASALMASPANPPEGASA